MTRILTTILFLICLLSCSTNPHWTEFWGHGLPSQDEGYEDLIFLNDSLGFIGGSRTILTGHTGDKINFTQKTVLYKTLDKGKTWKSIPLDYKGGIEKIFSFKDTLILLLQYVTEDTSYIIRSVDNGKNWTKIFTYSTNKRYNWIRGVYFDNSVSGQIIIDNRYEQYLLNYHNNKWDTILKLPNDCYHHDIYRNYILSLIPDSQANSKGILITTTDSTKTKNVFFDKPYYIASTTKSGEGLFLAAHDKDKGKILKFENNQITNIELGKFSDYMPDQIFAYKKMILAVASRQKDAALLGVMHSLLISQDSGKTWELEELPDPLSYNPAFLYQDKFFISSALIGRFQLRK